MSRTSSLTFRPRRQHVIEAAVADVVGPAVAADHPDALGDEGIGDREQFHRPEARQARQALAQFGHRLDAGPPERASSVVAQGFRKAVDQRFRQGRGQSTSSWTARRVRESTPSRNPRPSSAASSNSELFQAGPRPCLVRGVGRGRQIAAVDGRASGRVGDQQPVAEELRQQADVGSFTTPRTGTRRTRTGAATAAGSCSRAEFGCAADRELPRTSRNAALDLPMLVGRLGD